jgi:hypothetical protein
MTVVGVFGVWGVVSAQDDIEDPSDNHPANAVSSDTVDGIDNPPKSEKKSSKSKKKDEDCGGLCNDVIMTVTDSVAVIHAAAAPKPSKKSKSGKSGESKAEKSKADNDGTAMKANGLVAVGVDFNNKKDEGKEKNRRLARGELELSAQPVKKVKADISIEYNMKRDSLGIVVDKIYAQYNAVSNGSVRVGLFKKSFGLEERSGLDERYFFKRSIVNEGLEKFSFLDHDPTIAYRHDLLNDKLRLTGAFSWSEKKASMYLQNYSAHYRPSDKTEFILAGVVRHKTEEDVFWDSDSLFTNFAAALSFRHETKICVTEAELTLGTNPDTRLFWQRKAMLAGARVQEQVPINIDTKTLRSIVPLAEVAVYTPDLDSGYTDIQIRAGLALGFAKNSALQLRNNFGTIIRKEKGAKESNAKQYRFDSEVVVIF